MTRYIIIISLIFWLWRCLKNLRISFDTDIGFIIYNVFWNKRVLKIEMVWNVCFTNVLLALDTKSIIFVSPSIVFLASGL